jgi:hypothetical protein
MSEVEPAAYSERLYLELGRIVNVPLPDGAINGILRNFPDWEYRAAKINNKPLQILQRRVVGSQVKLYAGPAQPGRTVTIEDTSITIATNRLTAGDLCYLIDLEEQFPDIEPELEDTVNEQILRVRADFSERQARINKGKWVKNDVQELVEEQVKTVLSILTLFDNQALVAKALGTSAASVSRLLKPVYEKYGFEDYIELMIFAIQTGAATLGDIPEGRTRDLGERDKKLLSTFYSPNILERNAYRRAYKKAGTRWSRLFSKLGAGRREAVLFAIRDGLLEVEGQSKEVL